MPDRPRRISVRPSTAFPPVFTDTLLMCVHVQSDSQLARPCRGPLVRSVAPHPRKAT